MDRLRVTIRQAPELATEQLLEQTLQAAQFWRRIDAARDALQLAGENFSVVIKPDIDVYDLALPCGTDPALVGHLAALLCERGYTSVTVIDSRNSRDSWLLNREPLVVADFAGYDFASESYTLAGNSPEVSAADIWRGAAFRINFPRNRTHETFTYALCAHNLIGVSPTGDQPRDVAERCLQVLRQAPPQFNIIDATLSCHGGAGERAPKILRTATLLASADALLADLGGASKMGLDPYASPVNAKCMRALGLPAAYDIDGSLAPYPMWQNVHPLVADSARRRNAVNGIGRIAEAWFQRVDREHFPFREFYNDRVNAFVAPLMERLGDDARAQWTVVVLNYAVAWLGNAIDAQYTLFAKNRLERQNKTLEIDLTRFTQRAYTDLPAYLAPVERLLADTPPDTNQIRLRRLDGAVLFSGSFEFPVDYGQFVRQVKIERAIQYMNDYIGGSVVSVATDGSNRVRQQAERNLYLQQPNWMVLFGGDIIDVEKLEFIEYKRDSRSIYWRTVSSPNGSADSDDGRVSFVRAANGQTRVEIFTRQKFALPLFFQVAQIDLFPGIRDPIITKAYENFFSRTISNMQAEYEGRDYRIGRDPHSLEGLTGSGLADLARYLATALATLAELVRHRGDFVGLDQWFSARSWTSAPATAPVQDDDGFRHFGPTPAGTRYDQGVDGATDYFRQLEGVVLDAPGFFAGLAEAVQRDFENFAASNTDINGP